MSDNISFHVNRPATPMPKIPRRVIIVDTPPSSSTSTSTLVDDIPLRRSRGRQDTTADDMDVCFEWYNQQFKKVGDFFSNLWRKVRG